MNSKKCTIRDSIHTFTGKELDAESNLYYYDARYNSSTYSQFTSVDPMSDKYPAVNPYLYCAGNPIKYVDPTGEVIAIEDGDKTYTFGEIDGKYGFYCEGQLLTGNDFADKTTEALCKIRKGNYGRTIVDFLVEHQRTIVIEKSKSNYQKRFRIYWNPDSYVSFLDVDGNNSACDPFISLAHEMAHVVSKLNSFADFSEWFRFYGRPIANDEKWATFVENLIRIENEISPRAYYSQIKDTEDNNYRGFGESMVCRKKGKEIIHIYPMFEKIDSLTKSKK